MNGIFSPLIPSYRSHSRLAPEMGKNDVKPDPKRPGCVHQGLKMMNPIFTAAVFTDF
jgi:hypothetical protein